MACACLPEDPVGIRLKPVETTYEAVLSCSILQLSFEAFGCRICEILARAIDL